MRSVDKYQHFAYTCWIHLDG